MRATHPEISDVIVDYDPKSLTRRGVNKSAVVQRFRELGNRRAARIAASLSEQNGEFAADAVDTLLIRVHTEIDARRTLVHRPRYDLGRGAPHAASAE